MRKKWCIAVAGIVVLAVLLAVGIPVFLSPTPGVTFANYSRIETGMTREDVVALLGKPSMAAGASSLLWDNPDADEVWVEFDKDGHVRASSWNGSPEERSSLQRLRDRLPFLARKPPPRLEVLIL